MSAPELVPPPAVEPLPALDAAQQAVVDAVGAPGTHVRVAGEPGAGKTTLAIAIVADAVRAGRVSPESVLLMTPTRQAAARQRDRVSAAMGVATGAPTVRSAASTAFSILAALARSLDEPTPQLISGADQDAILRDLLAGHRGGLVSGPDWSPIMPPESTALPGFRGELRDLLMRAAGAGVTPAELDRHGRERGRPEWSLAAQVYREYQRVTLLSESPADQGARYDPAAIVAEAAAVLRDWRGRGQAPTWTLVVVDDAHDLTVGAWAMLDAMAAAGARLVLLGNPDEAVERYRGGSIERFVAATDSVADGGLGAQDHALAASHRQEGPLRATSLRVAARIGGAARPDRLPAAPDDTAGAPVSARVVGLASERSRAIAAAIRERRLEGDGLAWSDFAVIARSAAALRATRADLLALGVPCDGARESVALHREPAVAPLLSILRAATGAALDHDDVVSILTCRAVGLDAVGVRRLRRALLREERDGGGSRSSSALLVEAFATPAALATLTVAEARRARVAADAVAAARASVAAGGTAAMALWAAWSTLGVADAWRASALAGSTRDDADLDAVIALMRAAEQHALRHGRASAADFVAYLESQDLVADTLSARAARRDAVCLETPASAAGRDWHSVFVIGVEEGAWPNLRLRDSVLGAQHLAAVLAGAEPGPGESGAHQAERMARARQEVAADEARALYVAATRARERLDLICLRGQDERPSRFADWLRPADVPDSDWLAPLERRAAIADLRDAVVRLREEALEVAPEPSPGDPRVAMLARLADRGVAGAAPAEWAGVPLRSSDAPVTPADQPVAVSPSRVSAAELCPLRWALTAAGGDAPSDLAQSVGTLVHAVAEAHPRGTAAELERALDDRWAELDLGDGWLARVQRDNAGRMVAKLADYFAGLDPSVEVRTELDLRARIGRAVLTASIDRVHVDPDGTVVVADIKTGKSAESAADAAANAQLAMYQLGVAAAGIAAPEQVTGAELVFVGTDSRSAALRTQAPLIELESGDDPDIPPPSERLEAAVETMAAPTFVACAGAHCRTCPVRRSCPAMAEGQGVAR